MPNNTSDILFVHDYMLGPDDCGSNRTLETMKILNKEGLSVSALCSGYNPLTGDSVATSLFTQEFPVSAYLALPPLPGKILRMAAYLINAFLIIPSLFSAIKKSRLIYFSTPPLFTGLAVHILAQWFKKEYILEVRDLWPEAGIHLGYFKEKSIIYRFFRWCEELLINRAVMVVSVTRGVTENLQKRFPSLNIITVQNGVSQQRIYLEEKTEKQSDAPFKITYFGNMNASSDPLIIADIAKELPENMEIHLVGNGRLKHKLLNQCKKNKLQNVRDHGIVSHSELPTFLRQMDIAIIPILAPDFFRCVISNKLLEAMAAGLVVIFLGEGESAQIVQLSNCGIALPRGVTEIQQITDYLTKLQSNPHELPLVGERGRQFILRNFTREAKTATLVKRVRELL